MLYNVLLIIQILVALSIIGLVLIQHGKGADAGAAFGGGAAGTVFGSKGSGNFLSRATGMLAAAFFANSLFLAWMTAHPDDVANNSVVPVSVTESATNDKAGAVAIPSDVPQAVGASASDAEDAMPKESSGDGSSRPADVPN